MTARAGAIVWHCEQFDALSPRDLYDIMAARNAVFIVEQRCPFPDLDGDDPVCHHLWTRNADGHIAAYLRIVPPGVKYAEPSLGRILTTSVARGSGLGAELVAEGIRRLEALYGAHTIRIGAQRYLVDFYSRFGFVRTGYDYDEDDIPHSEMVRAL